MQAVGKNRLSFEKGRNDSTRNLLMITRKTPKDLKALVGKVVFHIVKDSDPFLTALRPANATQLTIGKRLGKVRNNPETNRICYVDALSGAEHWVTRQGIGFICDTEEEACSLDLLRDMTDKRVREQLTGIYDDLKAELQALMQQ
jgi:hypothetical protein